MLANGTQKVLIVGDDWGPAVTKTIIELDQTVSADSIINKENEFTVMETKESFDYQMRAPKHPITSSERTILAVYASDESGNEVRTASKHIAIELYTSPTEGSPFIFDLNTLFNSWCIPYQLDVRLNGTLETVGGQTIDALNIEKEIDVAGEGKICPQVAKFNNAAYLAKDGRTLAYGEYVPAKDDHRHPLVIWLHGVGEGGKDPEIAYLGNKVTALTEADFQKRFGGAYILVPQCPTAWMDAGSGDWEHWTHGEKPSIYTEGLFDLIDAYVQGNPAIDPKRIIVGGCSNGGFMTMELVFNHPDYFAAAYPVCQGYDNAFVSDKMIASIKDLPIWFTYSTLDQPLSDAYSVPLIKRLKELKSENLHVSIFDKVTDLTDRFKDENGDSYAYSAHWSWIRFFNNQCVDENGINEWDWLAEQSAK